LDKLTARELMVLKGIAAGMSTKAIAHDLQITFKTAACHRYHILGKLGAKNTADLICRAIRLGLIDVAGASCSTQTQQQRAQSALAECRMRRLQLSEALQKQRELLHFQRAVLAEFGDTNARVWKTRKQWREPVTQLDVIPAGGATLIQ
jgi:DNA-binding CsgD family transcriptional regulator